MDWDIFWTVIIFVAALSLLGWQYARRLIKEVTIFEYERGLRFVRGKYDRLLEPGRYRWFGSATSIQKADLRMQTLTVSGQDVLSADSITLKVSVAAQYQIIDPYVALIQYASHYQTLYSELQIAVREIISSALIDELLANRSSFDARLLENAAPRAEKLGLRLQSFNVRDIMLPGNLKNIFAQVVQARHEGLAALERARGETAALRNLANAAKLLEQNPSLLQLRLLQTLGQSSGHTVAINTTSDPK